MRWSSPAPKDAKSAVGIEKNWPCRPSRRDTRDERRLQAVRRIAVRVEAAAELEHEPDRGGVRGRRSAAGAPQRAHAGPSSARATSARFWARISRHRARGLRARRVMSRKPGPARRRQPRASRGRRGPRRERPGHDLRHVAQERHRAVVLRRRRSPRPRAHGADERAHAARGGAPARAGVRTQGAAAEEVARDDAAKPERSRPAMGWPPTKPARPQPAPPPRRSGRFTLPTSVTTSAGRAARASRAQQAEVGARAARPGPARRPRRGRLDGRRAPRRRHRARARPARRRAGGPRRSRGSRRGVSAARERAADEAEAGDRHGRTARPHASPRIALQQLGLAPHEQPLRARQQHRVDGGRAGQRQGQADQPPGASPEQHAAATARNDEGRRQQQRAAEQRGRGSAAPRPRPPARRAGVGLCAGRGRRRSGTGSTRSCRRPRRPAGATSAMVSAAGSRAGGASERPRPTSDQQRRAGGGRSPPRFLPSRIRQRSSGKAEEQRDAAPLERRTRWRRTRTCPTNVASMSRPLPVRAAAPSASRKTRKSSGPTGP